MVGFDMVAILGPWLHSAEVEEEGSDTEFGWEKYAFTREEHVINAGYFLLFLLLLLITLLLQFYVGKVWHLTYLPEAGATILLGMFVGGMVRAAGKDTSSGDASFLGFSSSLFFIGFLPPIIYNAGYSLKRRLFFANMGGIVALAIIGTSFSALVVGLGLYGMGKGGASSEITFMEGMCYGSLISATDPVSTLAVFTELRVDPTLFYLVFGESVLNDAIAITLFKTTAKFVGFPIGPADVVIAIIDFFIIFIGSSIIGYVLGLFSAYFFKVVDLSHYRLLLVSIFVCLVYIPFLLSESLQLSGIVTILFTAITTRRYMGLNMPPEAKRATAFVFELMAYMAETAVFLFLGMAVFSKAASSSYRGDTIFWTLFFCTAGRAMHVYPLLHWINKYREKRAIEKNRRPILIPDNTKHMVFFSGLRGAVAYALANIFPDANGNRGLFVATTMVIVLITIFLMGGTTIPVLNYLKVDIGVNFQEYVDRLKKQAKPYKFLKFERQYIYPIVVKGYDPSAELDMSSVGGSEHHFGSVHGDTDNMDHKTATAVGRHGDDDNDHFDDEENGNNFQSNPILSGSSGFNGNNSGNSGFHGVPVTADEENGGVELSNKMGGQAIYGDSDNLF